METFSLSNGVRIPAIGCGTVKYGKKETETGVVLTGDFSAVDAAVEVGYRLFDTAILYGNDEGIGRRLSQCGVPREELFISSKFPNHPPFNDSVQSIRETVESSLRRMRTEYYDLFLIHYAAPRGVKLSMKMSEKDRTEMNLEKTLRLWNTMAELMREGKLRAIGVSNFLIHELQALIDAGGIVPMVNQIRVNPAIPNRELIAYCQEKNILPEAHSPLNFTAAPGVRRYDPAYQAKLDEVGARHGKSWTQILLRYYYQCGICAVPGSSNRAHMADNLNVFDFSLTQEEMRYLYFPDPAS